MTIEIVKLDLHAHSNHTGLLYSLQEHHDLLLATLPAAELSLEVRWFLSVSMN